MKVSWDYDSQYMENKIHGPMVQTTNQKLIWYTQSHSHHAQKPHVSW